jgi:putative intracellular protease/amidase
MPRSIIFIFIVFSLLFYCDIANAQNAQKVLLIPREGVSGDLDLMLEKEVGLMITILEEHGFKVVIATASAEAIKGNSVPIAIQPDLKLSDVKVSDYAGFIMPCMAVGILPGPPVNPIAARIVKAAVAAKKPVAAQLGAVEILAEAGVLVAKEYAFFTDPLKPEFGTTDPRFHRAIYSGDGVVMDDSIITSGICPFMAQMTGQPDGTAELTEKFMAEIVRKSKK